jgi:uncharacterized membrane protein YuzA (DUF378 family)
MDGSLTRASSRCYGRIWTISLQEVYKMKVLNLLAAVLLIVGGLNWGLVALGEFDLVAALFGLDFGETNAATRVVYGLVGLAAVYAIGVLVVGRGELAARRVQTTTLLVVAAALALAAVGRRSPPGSSRR